MNTSPLMRPNFIIIGFFIGATALQGLVDSSNEKVIFGSKFEVFLEDTYASFNARGHKWKVLVEGAGGECRGCQSDGPDLCLSWNEGPVLAGHRVSKEEGRERWKFKLRGDRPRRVDVLFDITSKKLYGGPVVGAWPQQSNALFMAPFVTGFSSDETGNVGEVVEKIWFLSDGTAIKLQEESHLFITQNSKVFQLTFMDTTPYTSSNASIEFEICLAPNLQSGYACYPAESRPVDGKVIKYPIWSTWVRYKKDVDQVKVMDFADQIKKYDFPMSIIEIDDNWETCYGNHRWNLTKFPNPRDMVSKLQARGAYVTLWIHPFVSDNCPEFQTFSDYLVKGPGGETAVTSWWNGRGAVVDIRTKRGRDWFRSRLTSLKTQFGVDGFKFDAGEAKYLPRDVDLDLPNEYTDLYVRFAAEFGLLSEVRVGSNSRSVSLMERLQDKNSDWSKVNGMGSIIPDVLSLTASGYSTILPDMVGGNKYHHSLGKELFIRWLQVNTFLPYIQFSVPPWDYDNQTIEISKKMLDLHAEYSDLFINEIQGNTVKDGHRTINPVWWLDPTSDETSLTINDQFLVGDSLLVAPVIEEGAVERKIYFPTGSWLDPRNGKTINGPTTVDKYPAPIDVLPYFIRQQQQGSPVVLQVS